MNKEEERINELEEKLWQSQAKAGKAQEAVDKAQSTLRTVKDMGAAETVITAAEQAFEAAEADLAHAEEDIIKAEEELKEAREVPEDETEELKDADGDQQPKKKGKAGLVIGIIAAVALIGAGGWYYYTNFIQGAKQNEEPVADSQPLEMPDLTYEVADVAQSILKNKGIDADILFVSSEKVPKGLVALQSVSAGQEIDGDEKVTVYISLGPAPTPTPEPSPLPTPTPKASPKPRRTKIPEIVIPQPVVTPCPVG